jgi:hypothetical protein
VRRPTSDSIAGAVSAKSRDVLSMIQIVYCEPRRGLTVVEGRRGWVDRYVSPKSSESKFGSGG